MDSYILTATLGWCVLAMESELVVFTVGHSTRTLEEFIELLQANKVTLVVDVRTAPHSRHNPQFNKENLPNHLKPTRHQIHPHPRHRRLTPTQTQHRKPRPRHRPARLRGLYANQRIHRATPKNRSVSTDKPRCFDVCGGVAVEVPQGSDFGCVGCAAYSGATHNQ